MPTRNGAEHIEAQLEALSDQVADVEWELVVVDNGSTDGSQAIVERWRSRLPLVVVDAAERAGINVARNRGIGTARGDLLLFCDTDDVVGRGWIDAMASAAVDADVIGGRIDEDTLNGGVDVRRPRMPTDGLPVGVSFLRFAVGANLGVWRDAAVELGGFCESFEIGNDDVDFSFRAQLQGMRLGYAPDAVVAYRHRRELRGLFRQFRNYGRGEPLLYARFRDAGLARASMWAAARRWTELFAHAPAVALRRGDRSRWVYTLAYSVGRVEGSIRHRTAYL